MKEIFFALWFYLPAGAANMMPFFAGRSDWLSKLGIPIDFGRTFRGRRIFGDHKTIRGFIVGYIGAFAALLIQIYLYNHVSLMRDFSLFDYSSVNIWLFSAIFSIGGLGGDALESFFKRQLDIPPGTSWAPYDQMDWILGAVLLSIAVTSFTPSFYLWAIVWGLILHPLSTVIAWLIHIKDKPL